MALKRPGGKHRLITLLLFLTVLSLMRGSVAETSSLTELQPAVCPEGEWTDLSVKCSIDVYLARSEKFRQAGDHVSAAQNLRMAAHLQSIAGEREAALGTVGKAQRYNADVPPLEAIKTITLHSRLLIESGRGDEAGVLIDGARRLSELNNERYTTGLVLRASAELKETRGAFTDAEGLLLDAVGIFREAGDQEALASTLVMLAEVRIALGEGNAGLANVDEARAIFEKIGDLRGIARSRVTRGHFLAVLGKGQEALDEYLTAEKMFPREIDRVDRARLLNGIAYTYQELGELRLALAKRREALELFEVEGNWNAVALSLSMIIDLNFKLGDANAAFTDLKRIEDLGGLKTGSLISVAAAHGFVGDHYLGTQDYERAVTFYNRALPVFEQAKMIFAAAVINDKLGIARTRQGRRDLARRHFDTSLGLSRRIGNDLLGANTLFNLAKLERLEGNTREALRLSSEAIERAETVSASVRNPRLRGSHFASVHERYQLHIQLLMHAAEETGDNEYVIRALQSAERSRARGMLETLALADADIKADAPPEMVATERELRRSLHEASDRLANVLNGDADAEAVRRISDDVAGLEHRLADLQAELKQTSPIYSAIKDPPPFDVKSFQDEVLDERTVLIAFALGDEDSYGWAVDKNEVTAFKLPAREVLASQVTALSHLLRSREPRTGESMDDYQQRVAVADDRLSSEARSLSETILGPVREKIENKQLVVVFEDVLHHLSLAALPFPGTEEQRPLVDTNQIVYQPSAQTFALLTKLRSRTPKADRKDVLVFSDPVFTENDERLGRSVDQPNPDLPNQTDTLRFVDSLSTLRRLPGSEREAESIVGEYGSSTDILSGFSATRDALLETDLRTYKVLHLATHAIANSEHPEGSGVVLSGVAADGTPMDQLVRLQDIYALDLQADLVVLSACSTSAGKELRGEGVLSLNNAFIQAGSRSVLSTLWKVDDAAAGLLMEHFYARLAEGSTAAEALRLAQQELKSTPRFSSPFYWASFTLHGDPNVRVQPSARVGGALLPTLILSGIVLAGTGILLHRRRRQLWTRAEIRSAKKGLG